MPCTPFRMGDAVGIVCTRGTRAKPCAACGAQSAALCDFPIGLSGKTCDRPLCSKCRHGWSLTAPVQLAPAYREKHGQGDLCRIHAEMVTKGHGPGLLALCAVVRPARAEVLRAAPLETLPGLLDQGAAEATAYLASHPDRGAPTDRIRALGDTMTALVKSLRAAGDPLLVHAAEAEALAFLETLPRR